MRIVPPKRTLYPYGRFRDELVPNIGAAGLGPAPLAWFDASVVSSLTITSNKVSTWADLMGYSNLSQGTAGNRPLYNAAPRYINGVIAPEFDGVNTFMDSGIPANDRTQTTLIVGLTDSIAARALRGSTASGDDEFRIYNSGLETLSQATASLAQTGMPVQVGWPSIFVQVLDTSVITHWLVQATSGAFQVYGWGVSNSSTFGGGGGLRMGARGPGSEVWDGLIAEMIVFNAVFTVEQIRAAIGALARKWAIRLN